MLANWPAGRRIVTSVLVCVGVAVLISALLNGFSGSYPLRLAQLAAVAVAAIAVFAMIVSAITAR
ncbi:MAG: hypothetical protein ACRDK0_04260, partial [Solirubrobacteraceae bacterium]